MELSRPGMEPVRDRTELPKIRLMVVNPRLLLVPIRLKAVPASLLLGIVIMS